VRVVLRQNTIFRTKELPMTRSILSRSAVLSALLALGAAAPLRAQSELGVRISAGEPVRLVLIDTLRSGKCRKGDRVYFRVYEDVTTPQGLVLIRQGTNAVGTVLRSKGGGFLGKRGALDISIEHTTAVDGQRVPLEASVSEGGEGGTVSRVAGAAKSLVSLGLNIFAGGLFGGGGGLQGKSVRLESGTQFLARVAQPLTVRALPPAAGAAPFAVAAAPAAPVLPQAVTAPAVVPPAAQVPVQAPMTPAPAAAPQLPSVVLAAHPAAPSAHPAAPPAPASAREPAAPKSPVAVPAEAAPPAVEPVVERPAVQIASAPEGVPAGPRRTLSLRNGDRILGHVTGLAEGVYTVRTPYGTIQVRADEIRQIADAEQAASAPAAPARTTAGPAARPVKVTPARKPAKAPRAARSRRR
jgi:hypothetical protein